MSDLVRQCLERWGMADAACTFVAGRENQVYRVTGAAGDFALRIRRPGLRSLDELRAELAWLAAMDRAGLSVPRPLPSVSGSLLETVAGHHADMVGWLTGRPLGHGRLPLQLDDAPAVFRTLGETMARLHLASDAFRPTRGFTRPKWDVDGLVGEAPLWGRFWANPTLDAETRALLVGFRAEARATLGRIAETLDYGLIHADLVRENVLIDGTDLRLIDFDDGGFGFRLFDVATALLKNRDAPDYAALTSALTDGYQSLRTLDTTHLDLFMALRAVTYVGWIVPRMGEDGAANRNARFITDARDLCSAWLRQGNHAQTARRS